MTENIVSPKQVKVGARTKVRCDWCNHEGSIQQKHRPSHSGFMFVVGQTITNPRYWIRFTAPDGAEICYNCTLLMRWGEA